MAFRWFFAFWRKTQISLLYPLRWKQPSDKKKLKKTHTILIVLLTFPKQTNGNTPNVKTCFLFSWNSENLQRLTLFCDRASHFYNLSLSQSQKHPYHHHLYLHLVHPHLIITITIILTLFCRLTILQSLSLKGISPWRENGKIPPRFFSARSTFLLSLFIFCKMGDSWFRKHYFSFSWKKLEGLGRKSPQAAFAKS